MTNLINKDFYKDEVFLKIKTQMESYGFTIIGQDMEKPWGAFLVIDPSQILAFRNMFFGEVVLDLDENLSYSPKILIVAPGQKLSWQYHHRRSELWKLIEGKAAVARSETDQENPSQDMHLGEVITLAQGERHRLVGKESWGIVAEIWVHIDSNHPSDEEDIVRVQDDYNRS